MLTPSYDQLPHVYTGTNIQVDPQVYELENEAADPEQRLEQAMWAIQPWTDRHVLDLGAGTGFHLPRFHQAAQHVFAVEPDHDLRLHAMRRCLDAGLSRVSILAGAATYIPLRDASIDVCHARFAYFFAPDCDPGLIELERVMRPGGVAFIIENDLRSGTFARWLRASPFAHDSDPAELEAYWAERGFTLVRVASSWTFADRAAMEAVVRLEFGAQLAERFLAEEPSLSISYHYALYYRRYA